MAAAASALFLAWCQHEEGVPQVPFDAHAWKAGVSARAGMIHDVRANVVKVGATEDEVTALLGVPDRTLTADEVSRAPEGTVRMLRYQLDVEQMPHAFDAAEFVVHLSASGAVTETSVFTN